MSGRKEGSIKRNQNILLMMKEKILSQAERRGKEGSNRKEEEGRSNDHTKPLL